MTEQQVWERSTLIARVPHAVVVTSPSVRSMVTDSLPYTVVPNVEDVPDQAETLVAVGGGTLLDEVKAWRRARRPGLRLVAAASIWGSGAEASPIAVLNRGGKEILMDPALLPDVRLRWPELGRTVPPELARDACGDSATHAIEALVSPLATDAIRQQAATLVGRMQEMPLSFDPEWFELSAQATMTQAASSVGLVHAIAHVLEGSASTPGPDVAHARLCSTYLLPVLDFNAQSEKFTRLLEAHGVDWRSLRTWVGRLFRADVFARTLPALIESWSAVARDRCARTNVALVRPGSVEFFRAWVPA